MLFALQFAQASDARVIVTSSNDGKIERAKELGAFADIDYWTNPEWSGAVLELTGGRGVDHVIEVGGPQSFEQSLRASARRVRWVFAAWAELFLKRKLSFSVSWM